MFCYVFFNQIAPDLLKFCILGGRDRFFFTTMTSAHPTSNYVSHGAGSVGNDASRPPLAERMAGWKRSSKAGSFSMYLRYLADVECEKCA